MQRLHALVVLGTRPDAIKLAPLVQELRRSERFRVTVCATAQHREMLDQVLELFALECDHDLDLMQADQTLPDLTGALLKGVTGVLAQAKPDIVIVQGDTTTAMAAALAGFYAHIPVAHVEAGLRSDSLQSPWPEEMNRRAITLLASVHFAPTEHARGRLLDEGVPADAIARTGNTVIDALLKTVARLEAEPALRARAEARFAQLAPDARLILVTSHRRESWGRGLDNICRAIRETAEREDVEIVYPVHLNNRVREPVFRLLGNHPRIRLIEPLDYLHFVYLLRRCHLVLTDSGGVQEEAPSLGKPVLIMRNTTERPEGIEAGVARLTGTDTQQILAEVARLLDDQAEYDAMARRVNPYGDGQASPRIASFLATWWDRTQAVQTAALA